MKIERTTTHIRAFVTAACATSALLACGADSHPIDGGTDGGTDAGHDYRACNVPSDCIVVPETCCGRCGAPARGDAIAIAADQSATHASDVCGSGMGCPTCAPLFIDPTLVATCRNRRCELVDLLQHEGSACSADDDCRVRTPDCCPCGGDTSLGRLIGVASENAYSALVCDPDQACDECAPIYPDEVTAFCNADDHCETRDTRIDPPFDGGTSDAGRPRLCSLAPDPGPCEAFIPRYYYDAEADRCSVFIWGGCQGNDNNFESAAECAQACDASQPPLAACEVGGVLFPSGTGGIDDPMSCNTCACEDGALTSCTEAHCPEDCPSGTTFGTSCVRCGPVDNCEIVRTDCLQACSSPDDCADGESCVDAVCLNRCG